MGAELFRLAAAARVVSDRFSFRSCGIAAYSGEPASDHAISAVEEVGGNLGEFSATPCDARMLGWADVIYCMTRGHAEAIVSRFAGHAMKVSLLDPDSDDVDDPYGESLEAYLDCRDRIAALVARRLEELCE
jgi:protein-tyrosine-phosphatase